MSAGIQEAGPGIRDAGDSALLLVLEPVIDPAVNARAIGIAKVIASERIAGVRDVIPTYRSVAVHFDPLATDVDQVRAALRRAAQTASSAREGALIEIPAAYGGENGPDLEEVAAFAGLTPEQVVERHSSREYRVFMLGFLPGFAYMGIVEDTIAAPRKPTPRTRIPAGSVGIAGRQTGIYPRQSPGGWQLIGRTAVQVFDPWREPASLFAPGDRVRFVRTERIRDGGETEGIGDLGSGTKKDGVSDPRSPIPDPRRSVTVLRPGLFTTIQDRGRWGHQDRGVPVAGPMDHYAHQLANALVGNVSGAAALEATLVGPELRFEQLTRIAIAGADLDASIDGSAFAVNSAGTCKPGSTLRFGERRSGARVCIAFDGGVDVPPVLGSRATHVVSGLGGMEGRALKAGDCLRLGRLQETASPARREVNYMRRGSFGSASGGARLRIMRGPQDDDFDDSAFDILQRTRFVISSKSDRMGYRLAGGAEGIRPTVKGRPGSFGPGAMISDATFSGGLQVPPSGDPILLMADRQTTGGYPQIATVITADLPLAGQLAPGDWIEFTLCTRGEAITALKELQNGV